MGQGNQPKSSRKARTSAASMLGMAIILLAACGQTADSRSGTAEGGGAANSERGSSSQGDWTPSQEVELTVPFGAGGGTDTVFRRLVNIINNENLSSVRWIVTNREGAGGMNGLQEVARTSDNNHLLMATAAAHITFPELQGLNTSIRDVKPVANVLMDPQVLWTHEGSQYESVDDVVQALKQEPQSVTFGGGPLASSDSLAAALFEREVGVQFNYVPFEGGGEVLTALRGGQVDLAWVNPSEARGSSVEEGGNLKALGLALEERLSAYPKVKTLTEQGYDVVYDKHLRGVMAPPDTPDKVTSYYASVIEKAVKTTEWKSFLNESGAVGQFTEGQAYATRIDRWSTELTELLRAAQGRAGQ